VLEETGLKPPFASSRALQVRTLELDPPGNGELLVRVRAAGVCHSDLSVVDGSRPRPAPMALGHEAAGEVEAAGPGVVDVVPGDHVVLVFVPSCGACLECSCGMPAQCRRGAAANSAGELLGGGRRLRHGDREIHHHLGVSAFSERVVVDRSSAVTVPETIPFKIAALFGCALLTGAGAVLNTAAVRAGESVAVIGLGGVGLSAVLGATAAGAMPVIAVDPVESKRELALTLGATAAFAPDLARPEIEKVVPGGVRYAIEAVGSVDAMELAFELTCRGGTTVAVGLPHPSRMVCLPAAQIVAESRTVMGSYMGSASPKRDIPRLIGLWERGRLPVEHLCGPQLDLSEVGRAFDALSAGNALRQIVVP